MSKERRESSLSLVFMEKISGLALLIVGIILAHQTNINMGYLEGAGIFFMVISVVLIILGLLMIIAEIT
ncbi:hypothetical protein KEJ29_02585 [Candidatus Bathyarchaeota archaeon]|nr:hypothetical protein [Candidatus Bathyarchaeota archaeon]